MKTNFSKKLENFMNWLFPNNATCISCGKDLFVPSDRYCICEKCFEDLKTITTCCLKCGKPTRYGEYCPACVEEKIYFERNYSCFPYSGVIRKVLTDYKFNNKRYYYKFLASFYADKIIEENIDADIMTFAPMTKKHKRERGYNQCELIAKELSSRLRIPLTDKIYKKEDRTRQVGKSYSERIKNAENAYFVADDTFDSKRVLVIDDVFTTGSTMNNIAKALRKGKASSVIGLTLCNVELNRRSDDAFDEIIDKTI